MRSPLRARRWLWIVLVLVLLLGACTARYISLSPDGHHRFTVGREVRDLPLVSPTLLGWILPGDRARIENAQFSPDGEWLYVSAVRGQGDQLAAVTQFWPQDGVVVVDLRLITDPISMLGRPAVGLLFGTRIRLDRALFDIHPPITIDASTGRAVVIDGFMP